MICEECGTPDSRGRLGFEGDPPAEPVYIVTVMAPEGAAEANAPQFLCADHARQYVEGYIGYGWAVHADLMPAPRYPGRTAIRLSDRRWVSSLVEGSANEASAG